MEASTSLLLQEWTLQREITDLQRTSQREVTDLQRAITDMKEEVGDLKLANNTLFNDLTQTNTDLLQTRGLLNMRGLLGKSHAWAGSVKKVTAAGLTEHLWQLLTQIVLRAWLAEPDLNFSLLHPQSWLYACMFKTRHPTCPSCHRVTKVGHCGCKNGRLC